MQTASEFSGKKILLVDDDELFREVMTGTLNGICLTVFPAGNGIEGLAVLKKISDIAIILSDIRMPEMDGVTFLEELRKTSKIPFILQTGFSEIFETIDASKIGANGFLTKPFTTAELKRQLSIGLNSEEKEKTADEDFARIAVVDFISGKVLSYNIYVQLGENRYVKVAHNGEDLDMERVRSFQQRGIHYLFLRKADFREYLQKSMAMSKRVSAATTIDIEKRLRFLRQTGSLIVEKVLIEDLDTQAISAAKDFFETTLEIVAGQDDLFKMLNVLNEHSDHTYAHAVGTSIYAIMIAQAIGWVANPTVFRVGLAGLLHDIGLKEIDTEILDTPRAQMDKRARSIYETHTLRGAEILSSCGSVPEEVAQAVLQHHEDPHGFGYPRGVKGKDINPIASLIQVADIFCEYTIKNPDHPNPHSASAAIEKMEQLKGDVLEKLYLDGLKKLVLVK